MIIFRKASGTEPYGTETALEGSIFIPANGEWAEEY